MKDIEILAARLQKSKSTSEKIKILNAHPMVAVFLNTNPFSDYISRLPLNQELAIKQLIAIGQAPQHGESASIDDIEKLLTVLTKVDDFYREMGGIVGYHLKVLRLIHAPKVRPDVQYHSPCFIDITQRTKEVQAAIEEGIETMPLFGEMYPLGGAADRLHLVDETTGRDLPAAKLEFANQTLLGWLLRDLEAREYLYFKRTGKVLTTPVAIMTSHEKDNWIHIQNILEANNWFGRPKESFYLFVQPLVPAVNQHGNWLWSAPWKLLLKPGGHGAIWKLAQDQGVFDWFHRFGTKYVLVRQINNPLAGLDYGLLAFTGIGVSQKKSFGFASCPRLCLSAEGMNVLIERKTNRGYSYVLSNVEYTDFEKFGIADQPLADGEPYSRFTSNTNILFAELAAVQSAVQKCPFPGLIINLKKNSNNEQVGRLESAMQNIADVFIERKQGRLAQCQTLKNTFITYNHRHKTISTVKKALVDKASYSETPENCFYDLMHAYRELLGEACRFDLPPQRTLKEMLASHPSFVFLFHPALGPIFQMISEKVQRGRMTDGSEFILEVADAQIENLAIDGSLQILSKHPLGINRFSSGLPRPVLRNVTVVNRGVDWAESHPFWRARYRRFESLEIILEGDSEFVAENVCFEGPQRFVVRDRERLVVRSDGKSIERIAMPLFRGGPRQSAPAALVP